MLFCFEKREEVMVLADGLEEQRGGPAVFLAGPFETSDFLKRKIL